eukprot:2320982-Rhodomonas_salina.1
MEDFRTNSGACNLYDTLTLWEMVRYVLFNCTTAGAAGGSISTAPRTQYDTYFGVLFRQNPTVPCFEIALGILKHV